MAENTIGNAEPTATPATPIAKTKQITLDLDKDPLKHLTENEIFISLIKKIIPRTVNIDRFIKKMSIAVTKNPQLKKIAYTRYETKKKIWGKDKNGRKTENYEPIIHRNDIEASLHSFINCVYQAAIMGYELDGEESAAVPYWDKDNNCYKVEFRPMIKGMKRKAIDKGFFINTIIIYKGDECIEEWDKVRREMFFEIKRDIYRDFEVEIDVWEDVYEDGAKSQVKTKVKTPVFTKSVPISIQQEHIKGVYVVVKKFEDQEVKDVVVEEFIPMADIIKRLNTAPQKDFQFQWFQEMVEKTAIKKTLTSRQLLTAESLWGDTSLVAEEEEGNFITNEDIMKQIQSLAIAVPQVELKGSNGSNPFASFIPTPEKVEVGAKVETNTNVHPNQQSLPI